MKLLWSVNWHISWSQYLLVHVTVWAVNTRRHALKAMNAVKSKRNPYHENHFTRKSPTPLATSSMHWECVEQMGTNLVSLCEETNIIYTESNFLNQSTWSHCFLNVEFTTHEPLCKHSTLNKILYCIVTNYFNVMVVGLEDIFWMQAQHSTDWENDNYRSLP